MKDRLGTVAAWVTCAGVILGGVLFLHDLNRDIAVERELLLQAVRDEGKKQFVRYGQLTELINRHWEQREDRFSRLENEHKDMISAIATSADDLNYRLGLHRGVNIKRIVDRLEAIEQAMEQRKE